VSKAPRLTQWQDEGCCWVPCACEVVLLLWLLLTCAAAERRRDARMSDTLNVTCMPTCAHRRSLGRRRNSVRRRSVKSSIHNAMKYGRYGCSESAKAEADDAPSVLNQSNCDRSGSRQQGDARAPHAMESHVEADEEICQVEPAAKKS
jgi:hypothetical protein